MVAHVTCVFSAVLGTVAAAPARSLPELPTGPRAPTVVPVHPQPYWSWDRIPTSMHGADRNRAYNQSEVERLAKYQMYTPEKWYTPCGAQGPTQAGPECAIESKTEDLFRQIRAINPNQTTILYWNSMFDFSFYTAHQNMLDLEADGVHAFLRDKTGEVISRFATMETSTATSPHLTGPSPRCASSGLRLWSTPRL